MPGTISAIVKKDDNTVLKTIYSGYFIPKSNKTRQNFTWDNETGFYRFKLQYNGVFTDEQKTMYGSGWVIKVIDNVNEPYLVSDYIPYTKSTKNKYSDTTEITCLGDSLTYGYGGNGTTYPSVLSTLVDRKVNNYGISGEYTQQIMQRQGSLPSQREAKDKATEFQKIYELLSINGIAFFTLFVLGLRASELAGLVWKELDSIFDEVQINRGFQVVDIYDDNLKNNLKNKRNNTKLKEQKKMI